MKPAATGLPDDHQHRADETDHTPSKRSSRPAPSPTSSTKPTFRPQLVRLPPGRLSEIAQSEESVSPHSTSPKPEKSHDRTNESATGSPEAGAVRRLPTRLPPPTSEEEKLVRLRDAIDAKIIQQQQERKRNSYSSPTGPPSGIKRVSPIQEEGDASISPSLTAAFSSPDEVAFRAFSTVSTESNESGRTVRASVPPTPSESRPARTPSYPFPIVPRSLSSSAFHSPFTALSPTTTASHASEQTTPGNASAGFGSERNTPTANTRSFLPPDTIFQAHEDPRFPTPNLYNLVLQLNTEPGLEQWWATLVNMMHDSFKAERVTLIMPVDSSDIENAPWGQKATFSMNGPEEFVSHKVVLEQTSLAKQFQRTEGGKFEPVGDAKDGQKQKRQAGTGRPRLETRHSYAGHGRETRELPQTDPRSQPLPRPAGPKRVATHGPDTTSAPRMNRAASQRIPSTTTSLLTSVPDQDFSTIAGVDTGPHAAVFPALRPLDHEAHPLIESHGVNRVLERGRLVTVTRDYVSDASSSSNDAASTQGSASTPDSASKLFGGYRSVFAAEKAGRSRGYEESEQYPTSPWAQSPAPSPAMQTDEERNPFFAHEEDEIEESFNPRSTPKDYSQLGQVEAIGIERASTVIHLPLVHPALSQPMQSLSMRPRSDDQSGPLRRSNTLDLERKAPIAILSILSPAVPYPQNLTGVLKLLGPHLATSFANAQQFSSGHQQSVTIRHRRTASGQTAQLAPMTIEPMLLDDIVNAEFEVPAGNRSVGSITSPSDYSGRSRHSPSGSIVGTPGWDPASHGWTSSRSQSSTPYSGTDLVDNYFDSKRLRTNTRGPTSSGASQTTPQRHARWPPAPESRPSASKLSPSLDDDSTRTKSRNEGHEHSPARKQVAWDEAPKASNTQQSAIQVESRDSNKGDSDILRHHSLLHSYGADWETSFGTVVGSTGNDLATPRAGHRRQSSYSEDMPPPSERLLRTIIDSVPVQIFTAKPETGQLSWVNSKYLIYRGQEPRQALEDPWQAIHPDDRDDFMAAWYRSLRTAQQLQQKVRLERFDGSYRWFYVRAAPLKDKRQKIVHWIGTMMDFHEQHIAELNASRQQETAASEAKYRALANSSPQIVFAVSRDRGVIFCNSQWLHYSGQCEAQALGVGFMDHVHPDDILKCRLPTFDNDKKKPTNVPTSIPIGSRRSSSTQNSSQSSASGTDGVMAESPVLQMPQRKLSELASTGILKVTRDADGRPSYSTEVRLKSKEGGYRWHLVRVLLAQSTSHDTHEEETWYGTCTDIDDHKALERDLKETMDEKSRFLSNMSHEIRTPLNGITGMVNFLIDSNLTSEQMEHVNIIRASTEGLRGLINDILDLSKAEAGMIQLNLDWLYIRALIEEVNDLTSAMAIDKGLELNYLVDEHVPAQIRGDRFRLRQILLNIVGNAIKFTQHGEVFVRCTVLEDNENELDKNEMFIKFEVIDTGQGFTEREAAYLFKRFSQIDGSSTRQHGGTGLGLVISRQLAQLHGGDMSAKGVPNKGSTFTFYVKVALPWEKDQPPMTAMTPGGAPVSNVPAAATTAGAASIGLADLQGPALSKSKSAPVESESLIKAPLKFAAASSDSFGALEGSDRGTDSPAQSSASSDPSIRSAARSSSIRSDRSSMSSFLPDPTQPASPISLALPTERKTEQSSPPKSGDLAKDAHARSGLRPTQMPPKNASSSPEITLTPPMFSILVVCPLKYSRDATVQHISKTLPKNIPHQITARDSLLECQRILGGQDPVKFTHVVMVLQDVGEIIALLDQVLSSSAQESTTVVIITDLAQRRNIFQQAPNHQWEQLQSSRRLRFVFKPLKPSRFAIIFDPQKEREMSTDRNQDSAQQVAVSQKQVFEELSRRLGNRDKRVLLVEDNRVNQMVILKFLAKVSIKVETALDGVQCTEKVFSHPPGHYSIILCDLHMPNKDGYQTCKEIRQWEKTIQARPQPVIALSANVLGDVYQKCVVAGFNSYMTKPVDFKELSAVLLAFMDPTDPDQPLEFLQAKTSKR